KTPTAREIIALLRRVTRRLRARWPKVKLMLRADSHHSKPEVLNWLEAQGVDYIIGYAPNPALERTFGHLLKQARVGYAFNVKAGQSPLAIRRFQGTSYQAQNWPHARHVVCRAQTGPEGCSARFVVTSFANVSAKALYDTVYCGRGEAE